MKTMFIVDTNELKSVHSKQKIKMKIFSQNFEHDFRDFMFLRRP